jgi:signal transduction histidine kinase
MSATAGERMARWEGREGAFVLAMPFALLAVATVLDYTGSAHRGAADAGLAAAAGVVLLGLTLAERRGTAAPTRTALVAALLAVSLAMVIRAPVFGFFTFTGYVWAVRVLPGRLRLLGSALVALSTAISQTSAGPYNSATAVITLVIVYAINAGVSAIVIWFTWLRREQNMLQQGVIAELEAANARLAASLAENAELQSQLVDRARDAGVAEERQRLAREIHDTLAQGLTGIVTQLQAASRVGLGEPAGRDRVEQATDLARESLAEARRSVAALSPQPLDRAPLHDALRESPRAGRCATGWPSRSRRRGRLGRCAPRSRSRCCGPVRRRWPTSPSTRAPRASASRCPTWRTWSRSTCATTGRVSGRSRMARRPCPPRAAAASA